MINFLGGYYAFQMHNVKYKTGLEPRLRKRILISEIGNN